MGQCYIWKSWSNASSEKNVFEHNILSIDSCRFCVSLIRIYSYRWYPFFLVILSQISCFFFCFFCNQWKWLKFEIRKNFLHLDFMIRLPYRILQLEGYSWVHKSYESIFIFPSVLSGEKQSAYFLFITY